MTVIAKVWRAAQGKSSAARILPENGLRKTTGGM
jgi:hypothetical protein